MLSAPCSISQEIALKLYRDMLRIRLVEEEISRYYPEQRMRCPVHLCIGQEASAVAIAAHVNKQDRFFSAHRAHAHYLSKGGSLSAMIAEIHGKATGCSKGVGGSMHLCDLAVNFIASTPVVGGTLPVAAGMAFGDKMSGEKRVTVCFFGDAATEEGTWSETLNFAVLHKLPLVLVCEDNLYSSQSPLSVRQPENRNRVAIAEAHGMRAIGANGNRIDDLYSLASDAVDRARNGEGPTYLDLETYRWLEHCGPFDDTSLGYRTETEVLLWKEKCPLEYWKKTNNIDDSEMIEEIRIEIAKAFDYSDKSPYPNKESLHNHVYAN
jgi:TPP-dependent pyruvate/acetoin dehydrogenase alpha subunit